jgi:hypothetical protein
MHPTRFHIGAHPQPLEKNKFSSRLKIGRKSDSNCLIYHKENEQGAKAKFGDADVLLRRRA